MSAENDVSIKVQGDTTQATAAVKSFASALEHIPNKSDSVAGSLDRVNRMLDQARERSRRAADSVNKFTAEQEKAKLMAKAGSDVMGQLAGRFLSIGAAVGGAMKLKQFVDEMDHLADKAIQIGELPTVLQRVGHAAQLSGGSMDMVANSMTVMERMIGSNSKATRQALANMGLDGASLMAMNLEDRIKALAAGFQRARAAGTGMADMQKVMGRGAKEMINLLLQSEGELGNTFDSAVTLSTQQFAQIQAFNDKVDTLWQNIKAGATIGVAEIFNAVERVYAGLTSELAETFEMIIDLSDKFWKSLTDGKSGTSTKLFGEIVGVVGSDRVQNAGKEAMKEVDERHAEEAKKAEEAVQAGREMSSAALADEREQEAEGRTEKIQEELDKARIDMLPEEEQINALRERLKNFLTIEGADSVAAVLEQAQLEFLAGREEEAKELFEVYRKAQAMQKDLSSAEKRDADEQARKKQQAEKDVEQAQSDVDRAASDYAMGGLRNITADSLTSIGGGGGVFTPGVSLQERALTIAEDQLEYLRTIAANIGAGGEGGGMSVEPA